MQMTERDKRTIKIGAAAATAIIITFTVILPWFEDWKQIRIELRKQKEMLKPLMEGDRHSAKYEGILSCVPVFAEPAEMDKQKTLFRESINKILKQTGIAYTSIRVLPSVGKADSSGCQRLFVQCKARGNYRQLVDFLSKLYSNPYYVAVEELNIKANPQKRGLLDLQITISTYVKGSLKKENIG